MGENVSELVNNTNRSDAPGFPADDAFVNAADVTPWIVAIYYGVLVLGVLINLCLIISLLQQKKHGTTYVILQLAAIDVVSAAVGAAEVSALYAHDWQLHTHLCPLFLGTEVLTHVLTVYMHVLFNLHAISAWNLHTHSEPHTKNPLTTSDVAESSNECLVLWPDSASANRTLNIDYRRRRRTTVSILVPSMLLWFSAVSLSIPEYTLATTVEYPANHTLCTLVDLHYTQLFQYLLAAFRSVVPVPLVLVTCALCTGKLCNSTALSHVKQHSSAQKFTALRNLLLLSIGLSGLYAVSSVQRCIVHVLHVVCQPFGAREPFAMPPLDSRLVAHHTTMALSMVHYAAVAVRPVLCIVTMPGIMATFRNRVCRAAKRTGVK